MADNQLSRYGAISKSLPDAQPQGKVFFVAPASSAYLASFMGDFPTDSSGSSRVFTTIASALTACVSNRGDVIYVLPGHTTTITAAAGLAITKHGVSIIGLGRGASRPTIAFTTATTADLDVDADNVTIENFNITAVGFDAIAAPIDVNKTNFALRKCKVTLADATAQATLGILTDANASGLLVEECQFLGTADAGTATAIRIVGGDAHIVRNNFFQGAYTTTIGAIENVTTACTNCLIENNAINNLTASSAKAMVFVAASTGYIRRNHMQILTGTAPITGAAMSWAGENYYAATIATAGTLI